MDREGRLFGRKPVTTRIRGGCPKTLHNNAKLSRCGTLEKNSRIRGNASKFSGLQKRKLGYVCDTILGVVGWVERKSVSNR